METRLRHILDHTHQHRVTESSVCQPNKRDTAMSKHCPHVVSQLFVKELREEQRLISEQRYPKQFPRIDGRVGAMVKEIMKPKPFHEQRPLNNDNCLTQT